MDEKLEKQIEAGAFLKQLRLKVNKSLAEVGRDTGFTGVYISELERGLKAPSDECIRKLAEVYGVSEKDIAKKYGKVPLAAKEAVKKSPYLQNVLFEIEQNKKLTEEQKEEIYKEIYAMYIKYTKTL